MSASRACTSSLSSSTSAARTRHRSAAQTIDSRCCRLDLPPLPRSALRAPPSGRPPRSPRRPLAMRPGAAAAAPSARACVPPSD
jgi:ferric-dicitrate binding protein FerR (iron transport regulator)